RRRRGAAAAGTSRRVGWSISWRATCLVGGLPCPPVRSVSSGGRHPPIVGSTSRRPSDASRQCRENPTATGATISLFAIRDSAMAASTIDHARIQRFVDAKWDEQIVPQLVEYIRIPNKSPMFDAQWVEQGYMDQAVALMEGWAKSQAIEGMQVEVVRLEGRTPLIFLDIPPANGGSAEDCVLLYGHLDKQPEMTGWDDDLGPWKPVIKGDRLYGRGGADDGYAIYGSLTAVMALREQGLPHARCVVLIEACEESGSYDL